jgi:hypothetical protein
MSSTIKLKKYSDVIEEYTANAVITPGMLVEVMNTNKLRKHATAGGNAVPMFALEDELQGKGIDDTYIAGDKVQVWIPYRGDQVNAILADGEDVVCGDFLESNGAGFLQKHVADTVDESWESADAQAANTIDLSVLPLQIVGVALETKSLSGSSGEGSEGESSVGTLGYNKRIIVRIV